ncbi:hypothetical protein EJ04DRAFT_555054 [Polyplosphaeria fusca]|uniref:CFEM domain-containing protein n=1 Tax=Polyplosphaeria fusca TaxID=682080 RepID=A0A9P4UY12_9PLEO|nr:hypothetical protein EJ04DRAFT_555054 [Polyplosphaeria fusca]
MSFLYILGLAALFAGCIAQTDSSLPTCAQNCVSENSSSCGPLDVGCLCSDSQFLDSLTKCIAASCTVADQETTIEYFNQLCAANGITLSGLASASSTEFSSATATLPATTTATESATTATTSSSFALSLPTSSPASSPTSSPTSSSQPTSTDNSSGSTGLSSGASAGIGVGATLGVVALAVGAFFLYRRQKKRRAAKEATQNPWQGVMEGTHLEVGQAPFPPNQQWTGRQQYAEMDGRGYRGEMDGMGYRREMDGSGNGGHGIPHEMK